MQLTAADKATLYRELAKLIGADFHLDRATALLLGQNPPAARRVFLEKLRDGVSRGSGIAKAFEEMSRSWVTPLEVALVSSGEATGRLAQPFEHLARYFAIVDASARQMRGALMYPLILAHLGIVLPELPSQLTGDDGSQTVARIAIRLGALWLVLVGGRVIWQKLAAMAVGSASVDRVLNRLPLVGRMRQHWSLARFAQVFHAGLLAAINLPRVARMAGEASQSGAMMTGAETAAARIETGNTLASSLRAAAAFPAHFVDTIETAEEAGSVDVEMQRWAAAEAELAEEAARRLSTWLPKISYAVIALYVAWRIISMFLGVYAPLFKLIEDN